MKKHILTAALGLAITASPVFAAETAMTGKDILSTLKGAHVEADGWTQSFEDGGATIYNSGGNQSLGRWDVRGDQYCSVWPPSDAWACYAMAIDSSNPQNETVTWISADGSRSSAHLIRKGQ